MNRKIFGNITSQEFQNYSWIAWSMVMHRNIIDSTIDSAVIDSFRYTIDSFI